MDVQLKIVATGHRPKHWGKEGYSDTFYKKFLQFTYLKLAELLTEYSLKPEEVEIVVGGALGFDQAVQDSALSLGLQVQPVIPTDQQFIKWPVRSQKYWKELMSSSKEPIVVSSFYYGGVEKDRDYKMVDLVVESDVQSKLCVSMLNTGYSTDFKEGRPSGTLHTVNYAKSRELQVINWFDEFELFRK